MILFRLSVNRYDRHQRRPGFITLIIRTTIESY